MLPNLKMLRQEYGISQQRLGAAIGISQQSINQYENHNIEPEIEILKRMANYFNTSIDFIVGHTNERRRIEHTEVCHLNASELELVTHYRTLNAAERHCIDVVIKTLKSK